MKGKDLPEPPTKELTRDTKYAQADILAGLSREIALKGEEFFLVMTKMGFKTFIINQKKFVICIADKNEFEKTTPRSMAGAERAVK